MSAPDLPDVARGVLKAIIVALATHGLLSQSGAEHLIARLGLHHA